VADTTAVLAIDIGGPNRVDNQRTLAIQEGEKRYERGSAQPSEQGIGAGGVGLFCSRLLLYAEMDRSQAAAARGVALRADFVDSLALLLSCDTLDILPGIRGLAMSDTSQRRAISNYRKRLKKRGMTRFEFLGLDADRELIRSLAKRLADDSPDSTRIRASVRRTISGEPPKKGGVLNALRRSPLVGAELNLERPVTADRTVDL
jgi:hypothetical protein